MSRPRLLTVLRDKAPELTLEAISVVLAVLAALAVDEWRQSKADEALAEQARASLVAEIESNRQEVGEAMADHAAMREMLVAHLADPGPISGLEVRFEYSVLSVAAWETAQLTGATRHLDFDWTQEVSRLYSLQEIFDRAQTGVVERISAMAVGGPSDLRPLARDLRQRLRVVMELGEGLLQAYAATSGSESSS